MTHAHRRVARSTTPIVTVATIVTITMAHSPVAVGAETASEHSDTTPPALTRYQAPMTTQHTSDEQSFVEGGPLFTWHHQRHSVHIADGQLHRAWQDDGQSTVGSEVVSGNDAFVGVPVGFAWHNDQQFFARTASGSIAHLWWTPGAPGLQRDMWAVGDAGADPAAAAMGDEQHLFYVTRDGGLKHKWWGPHHKGGAVLGDTWFAAPGNQAKKLVGKPSLFAWNGQQHVVVRNASGQLVHLWWDPALNKISADTWNGAPAVSDPATLVRHNEQSVFYVNERGHVMRYTWSAETGRATETNWSLESGENAATAVDRPQVFGTPGQQHAVVRNIDGSATHYFKDRPERAPKRYEWLAPGTTDSAIGAVYTRTGQESVYVDRRGSRYRTWWDGQLRTQSFGPHVGYTKPTKLSRSENGLSTFVSSSQGLYITQLDGGRVHLTYLDDMSKSITLAGRVPLTDRFDDHTGATTAWEATETIAGQRVTRTHLTATNVDRDVKSVTETGPNQFSFPGPWNTNMMHAASGVVSAQVSRPNGDKEAILFGYNASGMVATRATALGSNSWRTINAGKQPATLSAVGLADSALVIAVADNGSAQSAQVSDPEIQPVWQPLPQLPSGRGIASTVNATVLPSGAVRVVARDEDDRVYTVLRVAGQWEPTWQLISMPGEGVADSAAGSPDVAYLLELRRVAVVTTNSSGRAFISYQNEDGSFPPFAPMLSHDDLTIWTSSLRIVQPTQWTGKQPWMVLGRAGHSYVQSMTPVHDNARTAQPAATFQVKTEAQQSK